jgi:hypothetical protein
MSISTLYEYAVLRLSPDVMRGEFVNIGLVVFPCDGEPIVRITAPVGKISAIDPAWNQARESQLRDQLINILASLRNTAARIATLESLGLVRNSDLGFFYSTEAGLDAEIRELSATYIVTRPNTEKAKRSKLHKEMAVRFKGMGLLGSGVDDLTQHRIVPHFPIPGNPDLKADFVYKNGVYRITQTLDYRVSAQGARQKISEACTKVMAAAEGAKAWGTDTKKFAIVNVPSEVADIADAHLDLLYTSGFQIFHSDNKVDLADYHSAAFSY